MTDGPAFTNHALFTTHFLDQRLPARPEWDAARAASGEALQGIRALFVEVGPALPSLKEAQLEARWVRQVLGHLGLTFEVQPTLPTDTPGRSLSPDYAVYADPAARAAAEAHRLKGREREAVGVARMLVDAKRSGTDFQARDSQGRTPRQQIAEYLHVSGVDWGVLTDGRRFRLVHRSVAGRVDHYLEADLLACLAPGAEDEFLRFYLLFGAPAQAATPGGPPFLDAALYESRAYAAAVGEGLNVAVFQALESAAGALVEAGRDAGAPDMEAVGKEGMVLLYRLLFLLYAEHRRLLPVDSPAYARYSLTRLSRDLAEAIDADAPLRRRPAVFWSRLRALFEIVDRGDPDLGVPAYDGGLFDPDQHPLLDHAEIGDQRVAEIVDLLARSGVGERHTVDYRDLSIRHLGAIYEGLLEYRVRVAERDLVVERGPGGRDRVVEAGARSTHPSARGRIPAGAAYLVTDGGERWATGSYYTPDFITTWLVREALEPLVEGRSPDEILGLRVLDPAMGSGHFLIEALDYLAAAWVAAGGAPAKTEGGDAVSEARRLVAERCLFGVDLNPMAVELAKLALWLRTMVPSRPLTFLDHNLRWGNALLGSRVDQVGRFSEIARRRRNGTRGARTSRSADASLQLNLFSDLFRAKVPTMVGFLLTLRRPTRALADVADKSASERALAEVCAPFVALADADLARLFPATGETRAPADFDTLATLLHTSSRLLQHPDVEAARPEAARRRFLHWELVFPEVYFDDRATRRPDAGFHAVLGNPPWVRQETIAADKAALGELYPEVFATTADVYVYFVARAAGLLAAEGRLGMVLPNKWLRADYGESVRALLAGDITVETLTDFGHAPVFPDADTFPCLVVGRKGGPADGELTFTEVSRQDLAGLDLSAHRDRAGFPVPRTALTRQRWDLHPPGVRRLLDKVRSAGVPLASLVEQGLNRGFVTGLNDAFVVDRATRDRMLAADPASGDLLRPFLRGRDIGRWAARWGGEWMVFTRRGTPIERYPAVHAHLQGFRGRLEPRPTGHEGPWGGRKGGPYAWFEVQDAVEYHDLFSKPKIVWQQIAFHSRFAWDGGGFLLNDKAFFAVGGGPAVVATLNSPLLWWFLWRSAPHMKDEALALHDFFMQGVPVLPGPADLAEELIGIARERAELQDSFLEWLRLEFGIDPAPRKLRDLGRLDVPTTVREVRRTRPGITRVQAVLLGQELERAQVALAQLAARASPLEARVAGAVAALYGLDDEDRAVLRDFPVPREPGRTPGGPVPPGGATAGDRDDEADDAADEG